MARNELAVGAPPEAVWDVLGDPRSYAEWVVGSSTIRGWDREWPAAGSRFHHRVGCGRLGIEDHTEVLAADAPRRLVLRARARPLGAARVEIRVEPHPAGALVTMVEDPEWTVARLLFPPAGHLLVRLRNGESLRRLRGLAEQRAVSGRRPGAPAARRQRSPSPRTRRGAVR